MTARELPFGVLTPPDDDVDAYLLCGAPSGSLYRNLLSSKKPFLLICDQETQAQAGQRILSLGPRAVLVKGGHMEHADVVLDILCLPDDTLVFLTQKAIDTNRKWRLSFRQF